MSDIRKRRSSFFPKPVEENEKQLELFKNMDWVNEEKENIVSNSMIFGGQGKQTLQVYTEKLRSRKQEYPKLVSIKQEEQIHLKEKLRKGKVEINWETACDGLTDFERDLLLIDLIISV
uniref:ACYPI002710 protein n=1 Tax=Acyrthosiphon pisum TaxID=7029 RepID=C4WTI9_ACYPI|nr:ACYPI002710 [Acyrthosiphon pisum]